MLTSPRLVRRRLSTPSDDAVAGAHAIQYHYAKGVDPGLTHQARPGTFSSRPRSSTRLYLEAFARLVVDK